MLERRTACAAAALSALWISSANAILPPNTGSLAPLTTVLDAPVPRLGVGPDPAAANRAKTSLEQAAGGPWQVSFDRRTGIVRRAIGTGIPLLPSGAAAPADALDRLRLESAVRGFLDRHRDLLPGVDLAELKLSAEQPAHVGVSKLRPIRFERRVGGVRVEFAQLQVVISDGELVYLNATGLEPIATTPDPTLAAEAAWHALSAAAEARGVSIASARPIRTPELVFVPHQTRPDGSVDYRLARRHTFRLGEGLETWRATIDAHRGELLELIDDNRYACALDPSLLRGVVKGGVRPAAPTDPEMMRAFSQIGLTDDGSAKVTDLNGSFSYGGRSASCDMQGPYLAASCTGCVPNPPYVETAASGILDFGVGGVNEVTNGLSTPADRTQYYHLNAIRRLASKWLSVPPITTSFGSSTNIDSACNAFWDGVSLHTFRSSPTCANTGESRDVVTHEWGHLLDGGDGVPAWDRALGEAYGDHMSLFMERDSCIAQGLIAVPGGSSYCDDPPACTVVRTCDGFRNLDERRTTQPLMTLSTAAVVCGAGGCGPTPLGRQCHCEAEVFGQTAYHLAMNLLTGIDYASGAPLPAGNPALAATAAWQLHERLFFNAATLMASYAPSHAQSFGVSAYDAFMLVDDDDADLANGTPHGAYIDAAFAHHELTESSPIGDSTNCTPPPDPSLTATVGFDPVSGQAGAQLSFTGSPASRDYIVYRGDGPTDGLLVAAGPILEDGSPTYTVFDGPLIVGSPYVYAVVARDAGGCESDGADVEQLTVALADLGVAASIRDPAPGGDGDGIPEVGETVLVRVDLQELAGLAGLTNAAVVLSTSDPLATVGVPGPIAYGDVAPGATVVGPADFEVTIDPAHLCASTVPLVTAVTADDGCLLRALAIALPPGPPCLAPVVKSRLGRGAGARDDLAIAWEALVGADGYNVWRVGGKAELVRARAGGTGDLLCDATPTTGCTVPGELASTAPGCQYYQVRGLQLGAEGE